MRLFGAAAAQEIGELGGELQKIDDELAGHEEKWLALSEKIEAAS
jgi:hypothetical protein